MAEELGLKHFDTIKRQKAVANTITKEAQRVIQDIMDSLESGNSKPNKNEEITRILAVSQSGETSIIKPTKVDLFLQKGNNVYLIDIKTAKPNKDGFKELKRTLLTWVGCFGLNNPNAKINSLIAIPYNPYEPKPYERWTMTGMLDLDSEIKVAEEFFYFALRSHQPLARDFLGGEGSYELILSAFEEVGCEMRGEIDAYFKKFHQH